MSLLEIALLIEFAVVGAILGFRYGRRRGGSEVLEAAAGLLAEARAEGVAEGAGLIQAVVEQHECSDDVCSIAAQRERAHLQ